MAEQSIPMLSPLHYIIFLSKNRLFINSYGIVAQEQQKVGCHDYATRRVSTKKAKPPANETKYSTNKGFYVWSLTVP